MILKLFFGSLSIFLVMLTEADGQFKNFNYTNYNTERGLSANVITDIAQEKDGFLWIATMNGLNRFDGRSFVQFNHIHGDTSSIANNLISELFVDANSNLWIGYSSDGIQYFDFNSNKRYTYNQFSGLPNSDVTALYVDSSGTLWAGFHHYGLIRIDPHTRKFETINLIQKRNVLTVYNTVYHIYEDKNQCLWLATHNGLYRYNKRTRELKEFNYYPNAQPPIFRDDAFLDILPVNDEGLWLASWGGGISYFDIGSEKFETFKYDSINKEMPTKNVVMSFTRRGNFLLLATRDQSLVAFDLQSKKFSFINSMLRQRNIYTLPTMLNSVFIDKYDFIWVGSETGLYQVNIEDPLFLYKKVPVTKTDAGEFYPLERIVEDTISKKIIIATLFADGLNVIDLQKNEQRNYPVEIYPGAENLQVVRDLLYESPDSIWVISRDFIKIFDAGNERWLPVIQPTGGQIKNKFSRIKKDPTGRLWITTLNNGVFALDAAQQTYTHITGKMIPSNNISDITFDHDGNVYISSYDKGLTINLNNGKTIHLNKSNLKDSLKSDLISRLITDRSGNLWICSLDNGVSRISNTSIRENKFNIDNFTDDSRLNLPSYDIIEDASGNIWIVTVKGLLRLFPGNGQIDFFGSSLGLRRYFDSYRFSLCRDKLYVSLYGGYYEFYPDKLVQTASEAALAINSFKVNGKEFYLQKDSSGYHADLTYDQNFISIDFTAVEFKNPQRVKILYRLDGLSDLWTEDQNKRNVSYSNLEPRSYTFQIVTNDINEKRSLNIYIDIKPPFWKTKWFYLLISVIIITIAYVLINYRIKAIKKEEGLKTEFNKKLADSQLTALQTQMNPHFIFNSLNSINRYIIKESTHKASDYLTKFSKLIRSILENSVEKTVSLEKELKTIQLYLELEALRYDNKFSFAIIVDKAIDQSIMIPCMIIQPFLENSIWHGILHKEGSGFIKVELLKIDDTFLACIITDNGIGRKKAAELNSRSATKNKSFGINLSYERLRIINEDFHSEDLIKIIDLYDLHGNPEGTRVEIKLKYYKREVIKVPEKSISA